MNEDVYWGRPLGFLWTLAISLGRVISVFDNQILGIVVVLAAKIALQDLFGASGISCLRIQAGSTHVRNHSVSSAKRILGST
jgi:hypothetical protein